MSDESAKAQVYFLTQACHDLLEIGSAFRESNKNVGTYSHMLAIVKEVKKLEEFDVVGVGTPLHKLNAQRYRTLEVDKYSCIYRRLDDAIYIYHITELSKEYPHLQNQSL